VQRETTKTRKGRRRSRMPYFFFVFSTCLSIHAITRSAS
jgi:hypothetical protein